MNRQNRSRPRLSRSRLAAALAALSLCTTAHAQEPAPTPELSLDTTPKYAAATPAPRRPLMALLDRAGVADTLDRYGLSIYGHVQVGYTYNFDEPTTDQNAFRSFDFEHDEFTLNQIDLAIQRSVDYRDNKFDVGFLVEWIYGGDAGLIHANGVFDWYDGVRDPENQFDPVQFYVDVTLPVLNGSRLRVGKFANLVGFESINPTQDFIGFYSRSFVFGTGYPFTHTGALFTFDLDQNRDWTLTAGITRGDEQSFEDNNDAFSFLGSLNWRINRDMSLYIANSTGPEQPDNEDDWRTTWDATFYWQPTDRCRFLANGYFVYDNAGAADGDSGFLYSVALLGSYEMCKEATVKIRGEYFHDEDGLRAPEGTDLYEVTVGLDVVPFANDAIGKNLIFRPEVRYDFSDDEVFDGDQDQLTFAIDAIFKF